MFRLVFVDSEVCFLSPATKFQDEHFEQESTEETAAIEEEEKRKTCSNQHSVAFYFRRRAKTRTCSGASKVRPTARQATASVKMSRTKHRFRPIRRRKRQTRRLCWMAAPLLPPNKSRRAKRSKTRRRAMCLTIRQTVSFTNSHHSICLF